MRIVEIETPFFKSFTVGSNNTKVFRDNVLETKTVTVDVGFETKKSVRIAIQAGQARYGCNYRSKYAEENNLKFLERDEMNYFWGESQHHEYFKLLSKQGKPELVSHIESLVEEAITRFGVAEVLPELTVNLILPKELK